MKTSPTQRHFPYKHPSFGTQTRPKPESAWMGTVYYWWWAYLKRNVDYLETCSNNGVGTCATAYNDFGDVRGDDFKAWWSQGGRGLHLFAEPRAEDSMRLLETDEKALSREEALTVSIPLYLPRKLIERRFKQLLDAHHTGKRGRQLAKRSKARYRIQGQPNVPALRLGLQIYDYKQSNPHLALWEIGNAIPGVLRVQKINVGDGREDLLLKKRALAATVSRYLRRVHESVQGAGLGVFP